MAHIITPPLLAGTRYCCTLGAAVHTASRPFRTPEILTGDAWQVSANKWGLFDDPGHTANLGGSVTFATCCITKLVLKFDMDKDAPVLSVKVELNGSEIWRYAKELQAEATNFQAGAGYEIVEVDLADGDVSANLIGGPNNTGEGPGNIVVALGKTWSDIGTKTAFPPANDNPCGNVWKISGSSSGLDSGTHIFFEIQSAS